MTALEVPRLTADGLLLRPWELADLPLVREASADPYIPLITTVPPVWSRAAGEAFVRRQWARAQSGAGYPFVIARTSDARPLGTIGLWLRDLPEGRATLGYWLAPHARGNGTAARALAALTAWATTELRVPRLQLLVEPWNEPSARTAERAGFVREGVLRGWQEVGGVRRDMVMYGRVAGPRAGGAAGSQSAGSS
ncbi:MULTISPECIES: GNAT family protein [unclassified Streptomyces]|uniref:GNAT family N-acetyltransferase n=1 Tax=unclassified Streptomyces TaxID=2593676 RepID=UPI002E373395|nr:GNAT family protein [Streptomyces sp. NBC_01268]